MEEEVTKLPPEDIPTAAPEILAIEEVKVPQIPEPKASGNHRIEVVNHEISLVPIWSRDEEIEYGKQPTPDGVELVIRNISDSMIATLVFEAAFYDGDGNLFDTVKHKEIELLPDTSRRIRICSSILDHDKIKSYDVHLIRSTTADSEKVQLRTHEMNTSETGEEEIIGIVKNLSNVKTNAAVVATFYDSKKENIGTKVVILRDLEPNRVRKYALSFRPQEGDVVRTYTLSIGEIAD